MGQDLVARSISPLMQWAVLITMAIGYFSFRLVRYLWKLMNLRNRLSRKRRHLEEARALFCERVTSDPLPENHNKLSSLDVINLLHKAELSPFEALRLYQNRTMELLGFNCVTDIIEEAEDNAKGIPLDTLSPICGLPVSIKENISVKGYDSSCGVVQYTLTPSGEDSNLVKILRHLGAVPFVMTTMSPTGICLDSSTEIYGKQRHPLDPKRITGGSSAGEAILIAKGGSPLGFATDIAGSIRIPAAWCGVCGFKPSSRRVSTVGVTSVSKNSSVHLRPVAGPMANHVSILTDAIRALLCPFMFSLDPRIPPLPFNEDIYASRKPLRIGYYTHFGSEKSILPMPAVNRAVNEVKSILESKGYEVIKFDFPNPTRCIELVSTAMFVDGGTHLFQVTEGDPTNARFQRTRLLLSFPSFLRRFIAPLVSFFYSKIIAFTIVTSAGCKTSSDTARLLQDIRAYECQFDKAWKAAGIDALIGPAVPFPAPLESTPDFMMAGLVPYLSVYNMLDCPAGVVPVTKVSTADVVAACKLEGELRGMKDRANANLAGLQKETEGLPIAVQVIGQHLCEEMVLRVMMDIETVVASSEQ